jgi:hypothetical protein
VKLCHDETDVEFFKQILLGLQTRYIRLRRDSPKAIVQPFFCAAGKQSSSPKESFGRVHLSRRLRPCRLRASRLLTVPSSPW